jgi:hypothetical protein
VLEERGVEGRKGLAWVGEASPRQVLAEGLKDFAACQGSVSSFSDLGQSHAPLCVC